MAQDKKGFILYADQKELFDTLSEEEAGRLIKHIFAYVNDENPVSKDVLINLAFIPIKQQLKRDLKKFDESKKQRSEAGKRSAEVRKAQRNQRALNPVERTSTKSTVTVNDTVNVTVKDKGIYNTNVFLKIVEYNQLVTKLGDVKTNEYIERLSNYMNSTGKEYASHYHTILTWIDKDKEKSLPLDNPFKNQVAR